MLLLGNAFGLTYDQVITGIDVEYNETTRELHINIDHFSKYYSLDKLYNEMTCIMLRARKLIRIDKPENPYDKYRYATFDLNLLGNKNSHLPVSLTNTEIYDQANDSGHDNVTIFKNKELSFTITLKNDDSFDILFKDGYRYFIEIYNEVDRSVMIPYYFLKRDIFKRKDSIIYKCEGMVFWYWIGLNCTVFFFTLVFYITSKKRQSWRS